MKNKPTLFISSVILILAADQASFAQWFPQPSHLSQGHSPQFIDAVDTNVVWAVTSGQQFTKTTNGGFSWNTGMINNASGFGASSIHALDADTAWVAMYKLSGPGGKILKTTDGGANWVYQSTAHFSGTGAFADFVFFWDSENGICVGDPAGGYFEIYTTIDGGSNWIRTSSADIPLPLAGEYSFQDDYATYGDSIVWFGTDSGRVYKSIDRGFHWTVATTPYSTGLTMSIGSIAFKDSLHGLAGPGFPTASNTVISSSDGGASWAIGGSTDSLYYKLFMVYLPGSGGSYFFSSSAYVGLKGSAYSSDDGNSWITIDTIGHTDLDFVNASTGWSGSNEFDSVSGSYLMYRWGSAAVFSGVNNVKPDSFFISVSPNPFSESVELKNSTSEQAMLKIFDVEGNLLLQQHLIAGEKVSPGENFPEGIYLVKLQTAAQSLSAKIVKTK